MKTPNCAEIASKQELNWLAAKLDTENGAIRNTFLSGQKEQISDEPTPKPAKQIFILMTGKTYKGCKFVWF